MATEIHDEHPNLVARLETSEGSVTVKWFGWRHPLHYFLSPTFPSRAEASWTTASALQGAGVRTPEAVFAYALRRHGFIQENVYVTRGIYPHQTLRSLLESTADSLFLKSAIMDLARSISRMHTHGIYHRDLTTGNFLVDGQGHVFIVDLNRARSGSDVDYRHQLLDLSKIYLPAVDPVDKDKWLHSFFTTYADQAGGDPEQWLTDHAKVRAALQRRRSRKRRLRAFLRGK